MAQSKDNPNPVVYSVAQTAGRRSARRQVLGASAVRRYDLRSSQRSPLQYDDDSDDGDDGVLSPETPRTAEERSVYLALASAAAASPSSVRLLKPAGFFGPPDGSDSNIADGSYRATTTTKTTVPPSLRAPSFVPSAMRRATTPPEEALSSSHDGPGRPRERRRRRRRDAIDSAEVFEAIRNIQDPEHPLSLESLNVVRVELVRVVDTKGGVEIPDSDPSSENGDAVILPPPKKYIKSCSTVDVQFTPTIPHCSMATLIGLSIRVKLMRSLPPRFKVTVRIEPGTHASEKAVNKQLDDKERVRAALENAHLRVVVDRCISNGMEAALE